MLVLRAALSQAIMIDAKMSFYFQDLCLDQCWIIYVIIGSGRLYFM